MMRPQPIALALVAGQHFNFMLYKIADIRIKLRRNFLAEKVNILYRLGIVKIRNGGSMTGRRQISRLIVWYRSVKTSIANEQTGYFVMLENTVSPGIELESMSTKTDPFFDRRNRNDIVHRS